MKPPISPCFSKINLNAEQSSSSFEEVNSITDVSLLNARRFFLTKLEIPEYLKITGFQPCFRIASASNGAKDEPSSVIKQIGFSGSSLIKNPGEAI